MQNLALHKSNTQSQTQVQVDFQLRKNDLAINFIVSPPQIITSEQFCKESYENWGLWETDVVEVFVTKSKTKLPYLELQLSPLQQKFALIVKTPRKSFQYPDFINVKFDSHLDEHTWNSQFIIPYDDIPGEGNEIFGNFHACLGDKSNRMYFGLNLNDELSADFHRPDLFIKLGEI